MLTKNINEIENAEFMSVTDAIEVVYNSDFFSQNTRMKACILLNAHQEQKIS